MPSTKDKEIIMNKIRKRTFEIIQTANGNDIYSKIFDISIIVLILLNVVFIMVDTFQIPTFLKTLIKYFDVFTSVVFTVEYLLRLWTAPLLYNNYSNFKSRIKYIFSFMSIIDLLAIIPFYLPMIFPLNLKALRLLRITRLFRVFKFNRYTSALHNVITVFKLKSSQLISSIVTVFMLIILSSILMYSIESVAQPDNFKNIFDSMWWAVATFTTVGYGDIYPITPIGKLLSAIIALLGIGLVAVPTGIISAGFIEQIEQNDEKHYCPYCGKKID